jgi:hypothetical protein
VAVGLIQQNPADQFNENNQSAAEPADRQAQTQADLARVPQVAQRTLASSGPLTRSPAIDSASHSVTGTHLANLLRWARCWRSALERARRCWCSVHSSPWPSGCARALAAVRRSVRQLRGEPPLVPPREPPQRRWEDTERAGVPSRLEHGAPFDQEDGCSGGRPGIATRTGWTADTRGFPCERGSTDRARGDCLEPLRSYLGARSQELSFPRQITSNHLAQLEGSERQTTSRSIL